MYDDVRRKNVAEALEEMEPYVIFNEQRIRNTESMLNKILSFIPFIGQRKTSTHVTQVIEQNDNVCDNV